VEYREDGTTSSIVIENAHSVGVNSASWAPPVTTSSVVDTSDKQHQERRFVSGGCDNLVKIWKFNPEQKTYLLEHTLEGHSDWVRDVAWSPSVLVRSYIASASQDRSVIIWTQDKPGSTWKKQFLTDERFPDVVWRASWSLSGNILAISGGDNKVTLWRESLDGKWESAGQIDE
jgi:protein transport protein SEC13